MIISQEIAEICGIHAGDGYLRNDGRRTEWDISGSIDEKEYYDFHMIHLFNKVFNLKIQGRFFPSRNTYGFVIRDKSIIEFAYNNLYFPYGNKSTKVRVPKFIFSDIKLVQHFLRGYFDTDGHFSCRRKPNGNYCKFKKTFHYYPHINFSTVSHALSIDLASLFKLLNFSFNSRTYNPPKKTESLKYCFELNGINKVTRFMDLIKPMNNTKTSRYSIWKRFGFCPTNISFQQRKSILSGKLNPLSFYKGL